MAIVAKEYKKLQRIMDAAQSITEISLPTVDSTQISHCLDRAANIFKDNSHAGLSRFYPLLLGRKYKILKTHITRFNNNFFPTIIRPLNGPHKQRMYSQPPQFVSFLPLHFLIYVCEAVTLCAAQSVLFRFLHCLLYSCMV